MADDRSEVDNFLQSHPSLKLKKTNEDKYRVVCELTAHEMPCSVKAIQAYVHGKKYKYQTENQLTQEEQEWCHQYLVLKKRGQLYCNLTKKYINNVPHHIKLHLKGRKFQKAVKNAQNQRAQKSSSEMQTTTSNRHETREETDEDGKIWFPSESESDSAEMEGLGPDFEADEKDEAMNTSEDTSYSFDIVDTAINPTEDSTTDINPKGNKRKHQNISVEKKDEITPYRKKKRKLAQ